MIRYRSNLMCTPVRKEDEGGWDGEDADGTDGEEVEGDETDCGAAHDPRHDQLRESARRIFRGGLFNRCRALVPRCCSRCHKQVRGMVVSWVEKAEAVRASDFD
jgi:hypothetical protein